jgi:hypothetical protein
MHLGSGTAERLCAALIQGSAVFGGNLITSAVAGLVLANGLLLSGAALAAVLFPSAVLVLGPADDDLEEDVARLSDSAERRGVLPAVDEQVWMFGIALGIRSTRRAQV